MSTLEFDRRKLLKWGALGVSAAAVTPLLASCSSPATETPGAGEGGTDVPKTLIRYGGASASTTGLFEAGLRLAAEEAGIAEIEHTDMAQATALLTMRSGTDLDVVSMSWLNLAQFREEGIKAVAMAPMWASPAAVIAHKELGVTNIEQLRGKRLGVGSRQAGIYTDLRGYLHRRGIDIEGEFEVTSISDQPVLLAMFKSGEFDAINIVEPLATMQIAEGAVEILSTAKAIAAENNGKLVPANCWSVDEDWLLKQDDPQALQALFARASEIVATEKEPWDIVNKAIFNMDESTLELWRQRMAPLVLSEFTDEGLNLAQVSLSEEFADGNIKTPYNVRDLIFS